MINFFRKKPQVEQQPEENYKVVTENNVYADRLIDKLEKENEKLREELNLRSAQIEKLLSQIEGLDKRIKQFNSDTNKDLANTLVNVVTSPGEARLALENASKDKVWMRNNFDERKKVNEK